MPRLTTVVQGFQNRPGYTLMRGLGRFATIRRAVSGARQLLHSNSSRKLESQCRSRLGQSIFRGVDPEKFVEDLQKNGISFGVRLPHEAVTAIREWADRNHCFADRNPNHGFALEHRNAAEQALGKPILVAQYFNTATNCPGVKQLIADPFLELVATLYLGSVPTLVGTNLWWTFPVAASQEDRDRHAHLFHRDVDDFRFFKLFFYITDVAKGDGGHVCVIGSQHKPPISKRGDRWNIRRYSDDEIKQHYAESRILEICGEAGVGFAEDTLCVHKGLTPTRTPRLLLQIQYALFDYGVMHDRREPSELRSLT